LLGSVHACLRQQLPKHSEISAQAYPLPILAAGKFGRQKSIKAIDLLVQEDVARVSVATAAG
jgi:hypothetical protein